MKQLINKSCKNFQFNSHKVPKIEYLFIKDNTVRMVVITLPFIHYNKYNVCTMPGPQKEYRIMLPSYGCNITLHSSLCF